MQDEVTDARGAGTTRARRWQTGYFALPGNKQDGGTKVHFIENGQALCKPPLRKGMELFVSADGYRFALVECDRCRQIANRLQPSYYE